MNVVTDLNITGKPAQFGRGVMQDVSDKLLGQFTDCLEEKLIAGQEPTESETAVADTEAVEVPAPDASSPEPVPGPAPDLGHHPSGSGAAPAPEPAPAGRMNNMRGLDGGPGPADDGALDLGATVLPVFARTYWKHVLGLIVVLVVLRRLFRR